MPDADRFDRLWRESEGSVRRLVSRWFSNPDDRADALQDVRVRAWIGFPAYDPANPFGSWVRSVALHQITDAHRRSSSLLS